MKKTHTTLVEALHNPACYPHPVNRVKLVETHISWVFLAGQYAYKLKKPVNYGFLDFSTLALRQHFCEEELRLNRRFSRQLYLEVVSIGNTANTPVVGEIPAIDFMVKMKRFSHRDELDRMLQEKRLTVEMIEQFADYLATCHQQVPQLGQATDFGTPAAIHQPEMENFEQIRQLLTDDRHQAQLTRLQQWTETSHIRLHQLLRQRKTAGQIRECHGDVHLANMVWHNDQPLLFDCIEFNDNLRCIDPVCDYAFLLMDLADRGATELAGYFLNRYLQRSGDYQGLPLLDYYCCYRAMVRAKVFCLRLQQKGLSERERQRNIELAESYLQLAESYAVPRKAALIITHGFSGCGKSTLVHQLAPQLNAISIHSDIERKRQHGLEMTAQSGSQIDAGIYSEQASKQTYQYLQQLAAGIIAAGFPVIVDATFLQQEQRRLFNQLAERLRVPLLILDFLLEQDELFRRVSQRETQAEQVSEANTAVLQQQLKSAQPLTDGEQERSIKVTTTHSAAEVAEEIRRKI